MKNIAFIFFTILLSSLSLTSQSSIVITGQVIEKSSRTPVEFATVVLLNAETKEAIMGVTSDLEGKFRIDTEENNFYIEVRFIGLKTEQVTEFTTTNNRIDLGTITLSSDEEVLVRAEKSQTVFKLDKRVFNVGKDLSSTGASALEVLNNVPSVNVNIEGQISLRGNSGVQILINGKPSVLASEESNALGSITADMVEKIEVITNPSAKYDAEGTAGIINIVLKKSEKKGLNGSVTLNTGIPNNHSIGLSLNRRTERFNLFSQLGYGKRTFPSKNKSSTLNKALNTSLELNGDSDKNEEFYNLILGADYHINSLNVLTLSGHFAFENEKENADQKYRLLDSEGKLSDAWTRVEKTTATNPKWEYEFQYKKDFQNDKDRSLLLSALGSSFSKDKKSNFENVTSEGTIPNFKQNSHTNFKQKEYTFKLDYTHPFNKKYTLETGAQYVIDDVSNTYEVNDLVNTNWVENPNYSNDFIFNQSVLGLYSTFAFEKDKWGVKAGLRMEYTSLETELINTNTQNDQQYIRFFPSAHTSYKINDQFAIQAGYSKRIYRPRLWDLNPFFTFRDNYNISTGNPNLNPEYTHSFEITSIYTFQKGSLNFGLYHLATNDVIERVSQFKDNVSTTMPQNIGQKNATGIEFNGKYSPNDWLSFTTDANLNTFIRKGNFEQNSFDFNGHRWSAKATSKLKLPAKLTLEITGDYRSKFKTVQGTELDNLFMNIGVRKKIFKNKAVINLSVRDVFASRKHRFITDQPTFYKTSNRQRGRYINLGFSFGFGKGEAMEFSGQKRF